jgi:hypothetical protein
MKQNNHNYHEEMIRYGEPFFGTTRRRSRSATALAYNDRSPEVGAMNAHLRTAAYNAARFEDEAGALPRLTNGAVRTGGKIRSFLHLGRQYDLQARANFKKEAALLAFIVVLSIWPIIHAIKAMAGR